MLGVSNADVLVIAGAALVCALVVFFAYKQLLFTTFDPEVARVYGVPREIDTDVARLKLAAMGVDIDQLTQEQASYLASWEQGT